MRKLLTAAVMALIMAASVVAQKDYSALDKLADLPKDAWIEFAKAADSADVFEYNPARVRWLDRSVRSWIRTIDSNDRTVLSTVQLEFRCGFEEVRELSTVFYYLHKLRRDSAGNEVRGDRVKLAKPRTVGLAADAPFRSILPESIEEELYLVICHEKKP